MFVFRSLIVLLLLAFVTAIGVALAPLATTPPGAAGFDAEFVEFMTPRLLVLHEAAEAIEGMVDERSRNVLALRAEARRIDALTDQIDGYLDERPLTPAEARVATHYRTGAASIQRAIDAAEEAIARFDFSAMPAMIPVFAAGTDEIEAALDALETERNAGSSYTVDSAA